MEFQTNPYLVWQLIPGLSLLGIGLYIQSRPVKKRESNVFSLLMFGGSWWAFANAVQWITPGLEWQRFWNNATYIGIMTVPTAWFLLSAKLTGVLRERIEKYEKYFWIPPALFYLVLLTSGWHHLFFTSFNAVTIGGYVALENHYGILFYLHTVYSYVIMILGIGILGFSLVTRFTKYGVQAYGLIIGVLAPLLGNAYFLFGAPPPGFPDPTPIIFTITGVAFAWVIFGGHILEVVPLAHESIVRKLSTGVMVLDADKNIRDINDAARQMLGLSSKTYAGKSLAALVEQNRDVARVVDEALDSALQEDRQLQVAFPATRRTFSVHISHIGDGLENTTGWLIQFNDISDKKKAEEGLVATQMTMKAVLDTLQDSFFEADPSGIITYANKAFIKNLGFSRREDVQGRNFRKFTDPKSVREIIEKFKLLYKTKQPLEPFEYHYRARSGLIFIAETTVSPIMDGDQVVGSRGLIRDITARVNAEKEILKQKDLLDSLLQQSPIAMVINDMDKRITMVNPAFEKLFGYSREEAIGGSLEELISPPAKSDESKDLVTVVMQRRASREVKRKRKDGSLVDVEMFAAPFFVGGERFGYLAFYTDISERLKAESDLEKTQTTLSGVLDTLQDAYFEADRNGIITFANRAFWEVLGYSGKENVLGRSFRRFIATDSVRSVYERFGWLYQTGRLLEPFDYNYRRKDGSISAAEMVVSPMIEAGQVVGARGTIRDISERIRSASALLDAKDAAEDRARDLAAINRVAAKVGQSLDLSDILQSVCRELTEIFEIRNAGIGLLTPDKQSLKIVAFHAADAQEKSALGMMLPVEGNTSSLEVIGKRKTVVIQDAQSDPRTRSIADLSRSRGTRSIMIVPLLARGEAIGTIGMPAKDPQHVFSTSEIELAETIASQIAAAVDNAQLHGKTESALGIAERDLEIGRQIQSGFFPEKLPDVSGWEIATHFHAARQVAGDFYDVFQFKNSELTAFIIADVCDKGVGAALFMVLFRSLLRAFSETHVHQDNVHEQLLQIIRNTNNFIAEYHGKSNMFATLFFGILDPHTGMLHYVNGGHEPPVILDKAGCVTQRLMPTGPAVGMFPEMSFRVEHVHFEKGDFLVGFTDGTTDAKDISGKPFSEERLLRSIGHPWTSIFSMLFELNVELSKHIGSQNQFDDITLIAFRRTSAAETAQHAICRRADIKVLGELRDFVESAAVQGGLKADDTFAFKLVVDELCANIIQYGYEGREPGWLSLSFDTAGESARLVIRDDGRYFSPEQAQRPDIEAGWEGRQIGGLGLYFVKELMENVTYHRTAHGVNQFILEKRSSNSKTR
jgi:sigma-B regulation protein RsbU (phosphoserine phosphatase)